MEKITLNMSKRKLAPFDDGKTNKKRKFEYHLENEHSFSRFVYAKSREEALLLIQDRHPYENPRSIVVRDVEVLFNKQKKMCDKFFATYSKESLLRKVAEKYYKCLTNNLCYQDGLSQTSTCLPLYFHFTIDGYNLGTIFGFVMRNKKLFSNEVLSFIEYFTSDETTWYSYEFRYQSLKRETLERKKCLFVLESLESEWPNQKYRIGKVFAGGLFFDILSELKKIGQENGKIVNVCIGLVRYQVINNNDFPDKHNVRTNQSPIPIYYASSKLYERYDLIEGNEFVIDASKHRSQLEQEMMQLVTPEFEIVIEISDKPVVRERPLDSKCVAEDKPKKQLKNTAIIKFKALIISVLMLLLPYGLFGFTYFILFYLHTGLFLNYQIPDGFYALAVFSMIFLIIGSTIMSPLDLTVSIVADITTAGGTFEIADWGGGSYSVGNRGDAGIGIIILKFIINLIIAHFVVLLWFPVAGLVLFRDGFAEAYIEASKTKAKIAATAFVGVGIILATIEYSCVHTRDVEYSPDKFVFETTKLQLVSRHFYKENIVADTYWFDIDIQHPHLDELKGMELQETIVKYNNEPVNYLTWDVWVENYKPSETIMKPGKPTIYHYDGKLHCTFVNYYRELGHEEEQQGYLGLDYTSFDGYVKLSNINISKIEFHCLLREVNFGDNQYSYIRIGNWKDILVKNNF